jgi:sortase A
LPPSGGGYIQSADAVTNELTADFAATSESAARQTAPLYYTDGSVGTLCVHSTGETITVYEGTSADILKLGAGHFAATSAWDGNVALCGHNRGSTGYFSFVQDLAIGDKVTYTTLYGSRTYEVYSVEQIGESDTSRLGYSAENILTLITCVENTPELRRVATLRGVL